jgi:long-chain acyl-CoA synthetase
MSTATDTLPQRPSVSAAEIFPHAASRHPDKTALITGDRSFTYTELDQFSDRVAHGLRFRGLETGDVISIFAQNSWRWLVAYHGILKAGGVVNPVNVMLTGPELEYVLNDCGAVGLFLGAPEEERVRESLNELDLSFRITMDADFDSFIDTAPAPSSPDEMLAWNDREPSDLGSIGYTSGTTGHPKGALQSLESVLLNCAHTATMHGKVHDDIVLTALPAAHVYGNVAINGTFLVGGTVILMERFDPTDALATIATHGVSVFEGVPTMYSLMLATPEVDSTDLRNLRVSTVGGQTFSPVITEKWEARTGSPLLELWGMTEVSGLGTTHSVHAPAAPASIGVSLPGMDLAILPLDGNEGLVATGDAGELAVRGPLVMLGYHGLPEATAKVLDEDGWLRTGDVAWEDATGHVYIVDRLKDVIFTSGYNVYPAEIERVVAMHLAVAMVAVGREPDEVKGEIAVGYVVVRDDGSVTAEELLDFCQTRLANYKRPRRIEFVESLPTTSSGKIMRRKLGDTPS